MNKKDLSEQEVRTRYITPALEKAGWNKKSNMREDIFITKGRVIVRGKTIARGKKKKPDYILYYKHNFPIAIVEAKDNKHTVGDGMQQGLGYAEMLDVPFVYSSNGDGFLEHDKIATRKIEKELPLENFPSPDELYRRYSEWKGLDQDQEEVAYQDYYEDVSGKTPHYFQRVAINRTVEAIARGQNRILLVMATGTGKTYTAFQIIWRLWKAKKKRRILFLVDRNVLADQTIMNDFKPFGDKMVKIKNRKVDKSYEIYLALYQGVSGTEEEMNIYKQFTPDFFDLVIIDECHRGSAAADSAWREILDYYKSATHIGMTATPKETKKVSNIDYFGAPIYTYSLKKGIEDGFLAPYKVVRITFDKDVEGYRPEKGKTDKHGNELPDQIYNQKDFDRNLIIDERTQLVAKKVTEYLQKTDRFDKAIVFCVDINHAERMRQALVNENGELVKENRKYIMRITGDNEEGKAELDNFINPEEKYPVIAVTSKLMTTGVDAQTCKLIVLDTNINSMTEFKQIIGRGTRINEEFNKYFFTIIDFRKATELFADPNFDGDPVQIYEPKGDESPVPPEDISDIIDVTEEDEEDIEIIYEPPPPGGDVINEEPVKKYHVNGVDVNVINERVQYIDSEGKLITESLKDYSKKAITKSYASLDDFLTKWKDADKKQAIINELLMQGVLLSELEEEVGKNLGPFDLICHVAFGQPPLTRKERAKNVKKRNYFAKYQGQAREVLSSLLDKYADEGIEAIEDLRILNVRPFIKFGTPYEIVHKIFGGKEKYLKAVKDLENNIYYKE